MKQTLQWLVHRFEYVGSSSVVCSSSILPLSYAYSWSTKPRLMLRIMTSEEFGISLLPILHIYQSHLLLFENKYPDSVVAAEK